MLLASLCFLTPAFRIPLLNTLKLPLKLLALAGSEVRGVIFYHHNYLQVERLKKEIDLLNNKLFMQQEFTLENARLKSILSFKQQAPYRLAACRVIARQPDNWQASLIIDKGSRSGIQRGMIVITYQGLVGKIAEVTGFTAKVMLVTDADFAVSAMCRRSRQEGSISGTLGNNLLLRYLPQAPDIQAGDTIITSGLNPACPKGLLAGSVIEIGKEFSGLSSYAVVKPAVDLSNLEEVLVVVSQENRL